MPAPAPTTSIEELKARSQEPPPPSGPRVDSDVPPFQKRQLPSALRDDLSRLTDEVRHTPEEVPETKIDLGPLPEHVRKKRQAEEAAAAAAEAEEAADGDTELRKATEARLQPLDFGDLVMTGRVLQEVPVLPGKFHVTYQSLLGTEVHWIERNVSLQGLHDNFQRASWVIYARMTMSVTHLNKKKLTDHYVPGEDRVDPELFALKQREILRLGERLVELIVKNLGWFDRRQEALVKDALDTAKNG